MLSTHDDGRIRRLVIDNPQRRNAIPTEEWRHLAELFGEFEESDQRVLIVTGAGGDFCSGADLSGDLAAGTATGPARYERMVTVSAAARALHGLTKPTLAAVDGVAVGAGMNLAIGCDLTIASDRARFSEIFVRRGLTVDFGGIWLLPRRVGPARARELALTGRMVDAEEALRYGIVGEVVPAAELAERADELAAVLAAGAPLAQRFIKEGLDRSLGWSFDEALAFEDQTQSLCLSSEDVVEGIAAFIQKRDPQFRGR
jgi:2-(1,2-epoxy-1,2-dihydrophenyl)acetyl-CoA isomerase